MKHFYAYPKIEYSNNEATNILVRGRIRDEVLSNTSLYYKYTIEDQTRAEIISHKYYGSPNYVWAIYYANNILHPIYDWPMTYKQFTAYIIRKYGTIEKAQQKFHSDGSVNHDSVHHYVLEDTYFNETTNSWSKTGRTYVIDKDQYIQMSLTKNASFVYPVSYYEYEYALNENKKNIVVLDKKHLNKIISEFENLFD